MVASYNRQCHVVTSFEHLLLCIYNGSKTPRGRHTDKVKVKVSSFALFGIQVEKIISMK